MKNSEQTEMVKPRLGAFSALALWAAERIGMGQPAWSAELSAFSESFSQAKSRLAKLGMQVSKKAPLSYANAGALGWLDAAADAAMAPFSPVAADMFFEKLDPGCGDAVAVAVYGPGSDHLLAGESRFPERFHFIKRSAAPWRGKLMAEGLGRREADLMVAGHEIGHYAWAQAGFGMGMPGVWSAWPELANLRKALGCEESMERVASRAGARPALCFELAAAFVEEACAGAEESFADACAALATDNPGESFKLMRKLRAEDGDEFAGRYSCHGAWSEQAFEAFAADPSPDALRSLARACMGQACACAAGWLGAPCGDGASEAIRQLLLSMALDGPEGESLEAAGKRLDEACEASGPDARRTIPFTEEACRIFGLALGKPKRPAGAKMRAG